MTLSNLSTTRSFTATAELIVNTEFHMAVFYGSVRSRPLNETGVAFLLLYDADARSMKFSSTTANKP